MQSKVDKKFTIAKMKKFKKETFAEHGTIYSLIESQN